MKNTRMRTVLLSLFVAVAVVLAMGCVFFQTARVGDYSYLEGNLRKTYNATLQQAWNATSLALATFGIKPSSEHLDAVSGAMNGTLEDGREFVVAATKIGTKLTEIAVRIGLGDREMSDSIHAQIAMNLNL